MTRRRRDRAALASSTEHALIVRMLALAMGRVTVAGHLALTNTLEHRGGCSRERCWGPCLEMQATIDAALDWLEAQEDGAAVQAEMWGSEVAG